MDTVNYQFKIQALLDYLAGQNYSAGYVSVFKNESGRVIDYLSEHDTLDDYLPSYARRHGVEPLPYRVRAFRHIRGYLDHGRLPSRRHPLLQRDSCYGMLSAASRIPVDSYIACCGSGWSPATAKKTRQAVSAFLFHLQRLCKEPDAVSEEDVWAFFYDSDKDTVLRGRFFSCCIRRFLRWGGSEPGGACYRRILPMVPAMKHTHKVFDCLSADEDSRLQSYILGADCQLSLRDRAIVVVARFCGLRACDIAALRMSDIDLGRSRLCVRQRKTGVVLEQALRPVVGNAVCRYVMEERPVSDLPELFLVDEREVRPLACCTVGEVCDRAYRLAGIRQDGRRRGSHLLRHRFAQGLVESGACDAAAMRLLGHASPSSLNAYLETDLKRLRDCALSISGFAIGKEVLA